MSFDVALWGVVGLFVAFLFVMEFYAATHRIPTISERIQGMGSERSPHQRHRQLPRWRTAHPLLRLT